MPWLLPGCLEAPPGPWPLASCSPGLILRPVGWCHCLMPAPVASPCPGMWHPSHSGFLQTTPTVPSRVPTGAALMLSLRAGHTVTLWTAPLPDFHSLPPSTDCSARGLEPCRTRGKSERSAGAWHAGWTWSPAADGCGDLLYRELFQKALVKAPGTPGPDVLWAAPCDPWPLSEHSRAFLLPLTVLPSAGALRCPKSSPQAPASSSSAYPPGLPWPCWLWLSRSIPPVAVRSVAL